MFWIRADDGHLGDFNFGIFIENNYQFYTLPKCRFRQNVWNSRINTTKILVGAIKKSTAKPKAFVSVSGVSLYEPGPTVYTETDNGKDYDFMSRLCLKWEEAADFKDETDTKLVCFQKKFPSTVCLQFHYYQLYSR